ncbi:MAG: nicotinamide-nucleotide adenylyltransferase [Candidatus Hodarchaeales archaeon]|jgi:nicotinamide-nucleotide adenylyltransferase
MKRALYIGRFNPPHKGHLEALKYIFNINEIDSVIIGIGSAQESHSVKNPLTGGERFELVNTMMKSHTEFESKQYHIVPLLDMNNNNLYVSHVLSICPKFDMVFSNNPLVQLLFKKAKLTVNEIPLIRRQNYSGTIIRNHIINEEPWEDFVPKEIIEFVKDFTIVQRLKILSKTDK